MPTVHALAAPKAGAALEPFEYDLPDLAPTQVDIAVTHCGLRHSDLQRLRDGKPRYRIVLENDLG